MLKMSKIDQIHLRAVMLCMLKMSKIDQIHLRAVMLCYVCRRCRRCIALNKVECIEYCTKDQSNVEDVKDRSNTPKGCNAMYVGDVEDGKRTYTHIFYCDRNSLLNGISGSGTSLILNGFSIRKKVLES